MPQYERSKKDRRSGKDRRDAYSLDYFLEGGAERRRFVERRWRAEMRKGWVRVSQWRSKRVDDDSEPSCDKSMFGAAGEEM